MDLESLVWVYKIPIYRAVSLPNLLPLGFTAKNVREEISPEETHWQLSDKLK